MCHPISITLYLLFLIAPQFRNKSVLDGLKVLNLCEHKKIVARCVSVYQCGFAVEIVGFLSNLDWFGFIHKLSGVNEV